MKKRDAHPGAAIRLGRYATGHAATLQATTCLRHPTGASIPSNIRSPLRPCSWILLRPVRLAALTGQLACANCPAPRHYLKAGPACCMDCRPDCAAQQLQQPCRRTGRPPTFDQVKHLAKSPTPARAPENLSRLAARIWWPSSRPAPDRATLPRR